MVDSNPWFSKPLDRNGWEIASEGQKSTFHICRNLWLRRNTFAFEGKFNSPKTLIHRATTLPADFQESQISKPKGPIFQPTTFEVKKWNAAINRLNATIGLGGIFRDSKGEILASFCSTPQLVKSPTLVEPLALRKIIVICLDLGYNSLFLKVTTSILYPKFLMRSKLVQSLAQSFLTFKFFYTKIHFGQLLSFIGKQTW